MKMKFVLTVIPCLAIGFLAGWNSYHHSKARTELDRTQELAKKAGIAEEQMLEGYKHLPEVMANMESDDRTATIISLGALRLLEAGKTEEAKQFLAKQPASYYVIYGPPENPKKKISEDTRTTLEAIDKIQKESATLTSAIQESLLNVRE